MNTPTPIPENKLILTATAKISDVFNLTGRGLGIILGNDIEGYIAGPIGVIRNKLGLSSFTGPEFVDGRSGSALAVVATAPDAQDVFAPGDVVEFFSIDQ